MLNHYPKQVQIKPGPHPITRPNHHPSPKPPFAFLIIHARENKSQPPPSTLPSPRTSQARQILHNLLNKSIISHILQVSCLLPLSPILLLQPPSCSLSISTRYLISRLAHHNPKIGAKNTMKG